MTITVFNNGILEFKNKTYNCFIGKNGLTINKSEGDGCTPIGQYQITDLLVRNDRLCKWNCKIPHSFISQSDGWCDDPSSPTYNQKVSLPQPFSCETLWREDHAYDIIGIIDYNMSPIIKNKGSAIFLHCLYENQNETEGCVALEKKDLIEIIEKADHLPIQIDILDRPWTK